MKRSSKIYVRKDTKRNLDSFVIDVKYINNNLPIWIHYKINLVKFLTDIKGIYRYKFEITFFVSWDVEDKKISVCIDTFNNYSARKWIEERIKYYPLDDINLYTRWDNKNNKNHSNTIQTTLNFIEIDETEKISDLKTRNLMYSCSFKKS